GNPNDAHHHETISILRVCTQHDRSALESSSSSMEVSSSSKTLKKPSVSSAVIKQSKIEKLSVPPPPIPPSIPSEVFDLNETRKYTTSIVRNPSDADTFWQPKATDVDFFKIEVDLSSFARHLQNHPVQISLVQLCKQLPPIEGAKKFLTLCTGAITIQISINAVVKELIIRNLSKIGNITVTAHPNSNILIRGQAVMMLARFVKVLLSSNVEH
ncbi:hypothetical protein HK098_008243, partial [Nowakowskiella sp. JEL0407]